MNPPEFTTLRGRQVELSPLSLEHAEALFDIGQDPSIWDYLPGDPFQSVAEAQGWIQSMLSRFDTAGEVAFCIWDLKTGRVAGSSTLLAPQVAHGGIEIGWTWYGVDFHRTHVNTDAKRTLLAYCFDDLEAIRVQLKTDSRNERSQRAIERLGARHEGVLRSAYIYHDGYVRDTVMYSILKAEWPAVRERLDSYLEPS